MNRFRQDAAQGRKAGSKVQQWENERYVLFCRVYVLFPLQRHTLRLMAALGLYGYVPSLESRVIAREKCVRKCAFGLC